MGRVNQRLEAIVNIELVIADGESVVVEAIVDTGFTGFLTLPAEVITELELPLIGEGVFVLGDFTEQRFNQYEATLLWDGLRKSVLVLATSGGVPLVGVALLRGDRLTAEFVEDGIVTIERRGGDGGEAGA